MDLTKLAQLVVTVALALFAFSGWYRGRYATRAALLSDLLSQGVVKPAEAETAKILMVAFETHNLELLTAVSTSIGNEDFVKAKRYISRLRITSIVQGFSVGLFVVGVVLQILIQFGVVTA